MRTLEIYTAENFRAEMVYQEGTGRCFMVADADIDADGSPHAYAPGDKGTDSLANAKDKSGNYVGILTDRHGKPLMQSAQDPAPGYYISTTSYQFQNQPRGTQRRYVNSETFPFIVLPPAAFTKVAPKVLGCLCVVTFRGKSAQGMVADIGPLRKVGELSQRMAELVGINPNPKSGGVDDPSVKYEWFPGMCFAPEYPLLSYGAQ